MSEQQPQIMWFDGNGNGVEIFKDGRLTLHYNRMVMTDSLAGWANALWDRIERQNVERKLEGK